MVAFLTVHKMTKRQPAKKATGAFMAVANRHIYQFVPLAYLFQTKGSISVLENIRNGSNLYLISI